MSTSVFWTETMIELPEVREGGMPGRNEQRKPGTTRGSPRRSRTAKASRISRSAVKLRCAHEWDGWGRLSDDGPGHYNPDPSDRLGHELAQQLKSLRPHSGAENAEKQELDMSRSAKAPRRRGQRNHMFKVG